MKQRKCPYKGDLCRDYGGCEDCTWNKIIEENQELKHYLRLAIFYLTGSNDKATVRHWIKEEKKKEKKLCQAKKI